MHPVIPTYILYSKHEPAREKQVAAIKALLSNVNIVAPVFPKYEKVPFLHLLISKSQERTGNALLPSEIGVLMSHRRIWQKIVNDAKNGTATPKKHFLILESDSKLNDVESLQKQYTNIENSYDLFFWGAWNNHVSIKRSTASKYLKYKIGDPMIRSVYGAYGYSLNVKGARQMLAATSKIKYPVDLYKHYTQLNDLRIGAIAPEIISTWQTTDSTIRLESQLDKLKRKLKIRLFSFRNQIQAYFC
jgi:GR25 family glycosyltransferase involved in LPS biosynthesis